MTHVFPILLSPTEHFQVYETENHNIGMAEFRSDQLFSLGEFCCLSNEHSLHQFINAKSIIHRLQLQLLLRDT